MPCGRGKARFEVRKICLAIVNENNSVEGVIIGGKEGVDSFPQEIHPSTRCDDHGDFALIRKGSFIVKLVGFLGLEAKEEGKEQQKSKHSFGNVEYIYQTNIKIVSILAFYFIFKPFKI